MSNIKKNCLSLHYNGVISYLFGNIQIQRKDSEINAAPLCLEKISKDF